MDVELPPLDVDETQEKVEICWDIAPAKGTVKPTQANLNPSKPRQMALWKLKDVYKESPRFTSEPLFLWIDPARIHNATLPKLLPGEANFYQTGPGLILFDSILVHSIWGTKGPNARAITVSNNNDPILVHFSKQGVKSPRVVETLFATWDKHQSYANTLPDSLQPSKECVGDTVAGLEAFRLGLLTVQQIFTPLYRLKNLPSIDAHFHKDLNYVKVGQCKKAKDVGLIGEPFTSGPFEPYISFDLFTHNDRFRDTIAVRTYRGEPSYIFPDFPLDVNFWGHNFYRWTGVPSGRPPRFVSQPPLVLLLVPKTDDKILCQMLVDLAAILSGNNQQPDQPCQQTAIVQNRGFRPSTNEYFLLGQSPFDIYETWIEISIMKTYFQNRPDVWSSQSADTRSFMPPELVRTGILPHLFKKWNINCAGALAKWTVSANLLKPNDWLTKLVDGKQDRIIQTVTLSAKKLLNAKADSRNSHPNQLAIMGCSASTVAQQFGWKDVGRNVGFNDVNIGTWPATFYASEWLHLSAYSYGGVGATPGTSQVASNLVFGTSETNSIMTRFENAYKRLIEKQTEFYEVCSQTGRPLNIPDEGVVSLHILVNDPTVSIQLMRRVGDDVRYCKIFKNETERAKDTSISVSADVFVDSKCWEGYDLPWLAYNIAYQLHLPSTGYWNLMPAGAYNQVFYPFQRRFYTSFETSMDAGLIDYMLYFRIKMFELQNGDDTVECVQEAYEAAKVKMTAELSKVAAAQGVTHCLDPDGDDVADYDGQDVDSEPE